MASYKAEFLSHYYENHRRPRQALTMGRIGDWAPWAARLPRLVNLLTQTPGLAHLSRLAGGIAQDRSLPRFARKAFRRTWTPHRQPGPARGRVILWVDTFCEHFHPEIAQAAAEVLGHAGFEVQLPTAQLCCGRPLYDFGHLDAARGRLRRVLEMLDAQLAGDGAPTALVGLEPGCMSVFKDELVKFFPDDARARRLSESAWMLGDFLHAQGYVPPALAVDVLVHAHCHQKSLLGSKGEMALLQAMGARATLLDSGCCGMAGSFGMSPRHAAMSRAVGELALLPALRQASRNTVILTNGFSCREQIRDGTGREAVHLAQLLKRAHDASASARQLTEPAAAS